MIALEVVDATIIISLYLTGESSASCELHHTA